MCFIFLTMFAIIYLKNFTNCKTIMFFFLKVMSFTGQISGKFIPNLTPKLRKFSLARVLKILMKKVFARCKIVWNDLTNVQNFYETFCKIQNCSEFFKKCAKSIRILFRRMQNFFCGFLENICKNIFFFFLMKMHKTQKFTEKNLLKLILC